MTLVAFRLKSYLQKRKVIQIRPSTGTAVLPGQTYSSSPGHQCVVIPAAAVVQSIRHALCLMHGWATCL